MNNLHKQFQAYSKLANHLTAAPPPVYLSLSSTNYISPVSVIPLSSVGEGRGSSLVCHTALDLGEDGGLVNWYYPSGSVITEEGGVVCQQRWRECVPEFEPEG